MFSETDVPTGSPTARNARVGGYDGGGLYAVAFVVEGTDSDIYYRRYDKNTGVIDANHVASGGTTTGDQELPAVGPAQCTDSFVMAWESSHSGSGDIYGIFK